MIRMKYLGLKIGGRSGIRTHGRFNPTLDFESSAFNRAQPSFPFLFTFLGLTDSEGRVDLGIILSSLINWSIELVFIGV